MASGLRVLLLCCASKYGLHSPVTSQLKMAALAPGITSGFHLPTQYQWSSLPKAKPGKTEEPWSRPPEEPRETRAGALALGGRVSAQWAVPFQGRGGGLRGAGPGVRRSREGSREDARGCGPGWLSVCVCVLGRGAGWGATVVTRARGSPSVVRDSVVDPAPSPGRWKGVTSGGRGRACGPRKCGRGPWFNPRRLWRRRRRRRPGQIVFLLFRTCEIDVAKISSDGKKATPRDAGPVAGDFVSPPGCVRTTRAPGPHLRPRPLASGGCSSLVGPHSQRLVAKGGPRVPVQCPCHLIPLSSLLFCGICPPGTCLSWRDPPGVSSFYNFCVGYWNFIFFNTPPEKYPASSWATWPAEGGLSQGLGC
uniref:uncharacterized protein LOC132660713 n=1 Tax=Panthera onca TaxID=9690 RepID=UPI0029543D8B|nr:uncharacterized protein LOC132660713 [Panthera onca]